MNQSIYFDDIAVGDTIPARDYGPLTIVDTVRWAGLQENWQHLHYDRDHVRQHNGRILVVDDNRDSAESMADMLAMFGNEVAVAHDGLEAVEAAERLRPEIVLMDVGMPRLNGYAATRRIRETEWGRAVTIVALTGWGQEGDRAQSRAAGCDGHLVKPVSLADLKKLLG
jgi:CheY-like chemotaxis protein